MSRCLELAVRGAGHVSPNPMVGCVIVGPEGTKLGEGWHQLYGKAHAEVHAVSDVLTRHAASVLQAATLYVNLEPCNHHGKTPPCTDLILKHGISRVVIGMADPFPKVAGSGIQRLRDHGVSVTIGVQKAESRQLNSAYIHHLETGRPLVTLKLAQTLDGRIAAPTGDARWISGIEARTQVHQWRAAMDGVLVGAGTARQDDPHLTVRHVAGRQPVRIVLDRTGILSPTLHLFTDAWMPHTLAVTNETVTPAYVTALKQAGGRHWRVPEVDGHLDLSALLTQLGQSGGFVGQPLQSLLVEAGPGLATAFFAQDLVDQLALFIAPKILGDGHPVLRDFGVTRMAEVRRFGSHRWTRIGPDLLFEGERRTF